MVIKNITVVYSRTNNGLDTPLVSVEVHLANGLLSLSLLALKKVELDMCCA